ncbi:MAG: hypothetical protein AB1571_03835 [Nanoarchaeota archaeon]
MKNIWNKRGWNKRAQMQIQETILVIFVFIIMLLIGLIMFYRANVEGIKNEEFKDRLIKFYDMTGYFPNIPEVKCSSLGQENECMDVLKMLAFANSLVNSNAKRDFIANNVTIFVVYPRIDRDKECSRVSLNECNSFKVYTNKPKEAKSVYRTSTLVSLYYPEEERYKVGKLVLEMYT